MKKSGFTLVELLAVIVILSIILVISIPKILQVIDESKKESIISSVKLIAADGEKEYSRRILTDSLNQESNPIECIDLNSENYDTCVISFNADGKATVTLKGKGKFDGYTCKGTKDSVACAENGEALTTNESCFATEDRLVYTIKNYDNCISYITAPYQNTYSATTEDIQKMCSGQILWNSTTTENILNDISQGLYTEQGLLDNNVIEKTINGLSITGYSSTCEKDVVIPSEINETSVTKINTDAFTTCGVAVTNLSNTENEAKVTFLNNENYQDLNPTLIFQNCFGLGINSVVIPNSITEISEESFSYNNITSLTIPSSVMYIGSFAFSYNDLTSVTFPNTALSVGCNIFYGNDGLSLTYPDNVTQSCS